MKHLFNVIVLLSAFTVINASAFANSGFGTRGGTDEGTIMPGESTVCSPIDENSMLVFIATCNDKEACNKIDLCEETYLYNH